MHRYPLEQIKETNASIHYLIEAMKKEGHEVDLLTFKNFNRISSTSKFWKSIFWIFYSPFLVFGKNYEIIFLDDSYPLYPALVKLVSPKSRVVIRLGDLHLLYHYSGLTYKFLHFFERIAWRMADEIIVISEAMGNYVEGEIGRRPKVILDPVDSKDFPEINTGNEGTVMFHGTLTKNKNVDVLLEAAKRLPRIGFVIAGDGPDFKRLMRKAPPNVYFAGWVPFKQIYHHISLCAVGVALRSSSPGNEYVVTSPFLQYGICGKPCLVTRRKVFGDYKWQFSGVGELVEKIQILLKRPEEGEKLRKFVIENHSAEKIAGEIWKILMQAS